MSHHDPVDVDEATVEVIGANDAEILRLTHALARGGSDGEQIRLAVELFKVSKRQEGILSESPGLEDRARQLAATRAELEAHYLG